MSCCGTSRDENPQPRDGQLFPQDGIINQQPMKLDGMIVSPPITHYPPPAAMRAGAVPAQTDQYHSSFGMSSTRSSFLTSYAGASMATTTHMSLALQSTSWPATKPAINNTGQALPTVVGGKICVSIDFGATLSGVAFGSSHIADGLVQHILQWPGSSENHRKIPSCLLYGEHGEVLAWGLEAKNAAPVPGTLLCEWFKLFLEPEHLRDGAADLHVSKLPPGKQPIEAIADFLLCLWDFAQQQIAQEIGAAALSTAEIWLTVPAVWGSKECLAMREAAAQAGLIQNAGTKQQSGRRRDRLKIVAESEAAAAYCACLTSLRRMRPSQNFMICNAGGGAVDLAVYKILGCQEDLEIGELCARSGATCGSLLLDIRFKELISRLLEHHPAHNDESSLAHFQNTFSRIHKVNFRGGEDDCVLFQFQCLHPEDLNDSVVGLANGKLTIPGVVLRREVFDPVVAEVLRLVETQLAQCSQAIHALLLVGGFSGSEYLMKRIYRQFSSCVGIIARPADADIAACRGAAKHGLAKRVIISNVIAHRAYILKVKLPAEQEDMERRPSYIRNDAGQAICCNRVQYLVQKGAVLRKGKTVKVKLSKFSRNPQDSTFVSILYISEAEHVIRYMDEGGITGLCKWTVDLSTLPNFAEQARGKSQDGFQTEFEIGLELDSAEIRGALLHKGDKWDRIIFKFLDGA